MDSDLDPERKFWHRLYLLAAFLLFAGVAVGYGVWATLTYRMGRTVSLGAILPWGALPAIVFAGMVYILDGGRASPLERFIRAVVLLLIVYAYGFVASLVFMGVLAAAGVFTGAPAWVIFAMPLSIAAVIGLYLLRFDAKRWRITNWILCLICLPPFVERPRHIGRRAQARLDRGECPYCGYPMKGLRENRCPECGHIPKPPAL